MQEEFEVHLNELLGTGKMHWMAMLSRVRQEAEAALPDQAGGYLKALSDFGEQIAKSEGGFLGFGGISKQGKAALNIVGRMLGTAS